MNSWAIFKVQTFEHPLGLQLKCFYIKEEESIDEFLKLSQNVSIPLGFPSFLLRIFMSAPVYKYALCGEQWSVFDIFPSHTPYKFFFWFEFSYSVRLVDHYIPEIFLSLPPSVDLQEHRSMTCLHMLWKLNYMISSFCSRTRQTKTPISPFVQILNF